MHAIKGVTVNAMARIMPVLVTPGGTNVRMRYLIDYMIESQSMATDSDLIDLLSDNDCQFSHQNYSEKHS